MPRMHNRDAFYKFATLDGARAMIEHRTLKWSAPTLFNDPFDVQTRIVSGINCDRFSDRFTELYASIVNGEHLPDYFDAARDIHRFAHYVRTNFNEHQQREAIASFRDAAWETGSHADEHLAKFSNDISANLQHGRVFCMAEEINNVVMWSHYAQEHRGVGFKFRVLDEIDHIFLAAQPIKYVDSYVNLADSEGFADHLFGVKEMDLLSLCWDLVYVKHKDWSYEREWRCYKPLLDEPAGDGLEFWNCTPELFEAVYLGCCMSEDNATQIVGLVKQHLPQTEVFRARKSTRSFDLEFDRVYP